MTDGGRTGAWLMVGGGVLMVLSYPLDWSQIDGASGDNPFHYPLTGGLAWVLVLLAAGAALAALRGYEPATRIPAVAYGIATGLAAVLMAVQLLAGGRTIHQGSTVALDRGLGMWLALLAALVSGAGAAMMWRGRPRSDDL